MCPRRRKAEDADVFAALVRVMHRRGPAELNDLADPALRRHLLRLSQAARVWYEELLTDAVAAREVRADTDVRALARLIEVTLRGSILNWTLYQEGPAADWLREDLEDMLRPHLMRRDNRRKPHI
jgi:hypothetical protein